MNSKTAFVNYRCTRCFGDFKALPGPIDCPNCGFKYIKNMDVHEKEKVNESDSSR